MFNDFDNGQCPTCSSSIFCATWGEWKCVEQKRRYIHNGPVMCDDYKKRPVGWKEIRCQCEDRLRNEEMSEEVDA